MWEPPSSPQRPTPQPPFGYGQLPYGQPAYGRQVARTLARRGSLGCLRQLGGCAVLLVALAVLGIGGLWAASFVVHQPLLSFVNPLPYLNQYTFVVHHGQTQISAVAWSPDGSLVASVDDETGTVQAWDAANGQTRFTYQAQRGVTMPLVWSPDGRHLALADTTHPLIVLDGRSGRTAFAATSTNGGHNVAWSPDSRYIAAIGDYPNVQVWDVASGQVVKTFSGAGGNMLAWSPDGKDLACNAEGVRVWDVASGQVILQTKPENLLDVGSTVLWSPDSQQIAQEVLGRDEVREHVWQVATGRQLFRYADSTTRTEELVAAWSPDSQRLAIGGDMDDSIGIWNVATGTKLVTYGGHGAAQFFTERDVRIHAGVQAIAWSPDGKRIVSLGLEESVQIWDPTTGALLADYNTYTDMSLFPGHGGFATDGARAIAWAPDGRRVAIAGDNFAEVWQP